MGIFHRGRGYSEHAESLSATTSVQAALCPVYLPRTNPDWVRLSANSRREKKIKNLIASLRSWEFAMSRIALGISITEEVPMPRGCLTTIGPPLATTVKGHW